MQHIYAYDTGSGSSSNSKSKLTKLTKSTKLTKHRVAFVYAGSARTFKEPFVHESQRNNLINAFCPPRICQSVVFARISLSDNIHQDEEGMPVLDGKGIPIPADEKEKPAIEFALNRIINIPDYAYHT